MADRHEEADPVAWMLQEIVELCAVARRCKARPEEISPDRWNACMEIFQDQPREGRRMIRRHLRRKFGIDIRSVLVEE